MTIPSESLLPLPNEEFTPEQKSYLNELIREMQDNYERLAIATNGTYLYSNPDSAVTIQQGAWSPEVFGVSTAGAGTYTQQVGYTVRKGLVVHAFFDIAWSAHTGSGNMYVELPYKVRKSDGMPFVGLAQTNNYTLGSIDYAVFNAIPDTYRLELWSVTTGAATANIALDTSARVMGTITYIGQENETE